MANNYLAIRDDIKNRLTAVPNCGKVHGYSRLALNPAKYLEHFLDRPSGRIKGWEITRAGASEHIAGAVFRHHRFVLRGFLGFQDESASDEIFQQLIEEVCAAFRTAAPGAAWLFRDGDNDEAGPAQVQLIEERMFGQVLCHYCEIQLSVTERINP